uniref:S-adenosylmethionine mitochondrial carrier protein n=1 Tax=Anthurium amnicola TaxID=1678845 RepID=A0A1D1ZDA8_9ARAE
MVPVHDPVESFFNSLHAFESGFRRAARDLESQWSASWNGAGQLHLLCRQEGPPLPAKRRHSRDVPSAAEEAGRKRPPAVFWAPMRSLLGGIGRRGESPKRAPPKGGESREECGSCAGCMSFAAAWSMLLSSFVQALPSPFKSAKKRLQKQSVLESNSSDPLGLRIKSTDEHQRCYAEVPDKTTAALPKGGEVPPLELLVCYVFDSLLQNLQMFDQRNGDSDTKGSEAAVSSSPPLLFDHLKMTADIVKGKKADVDWFLSNMGFARVGGPPASLVGVAGSVKDEGEDRASSDSNEEPGSNSAQKPAGGLLNIPLSNVERLRSTLSTVSLAELIEFVPHLGRSSQEHPDKKKLFSVQDFFRYTQSEGRRFFEELDRDGDGQVTLEDLEIAMRKRKLPPKYAREFLRRTRSHLFSKSFGWKQFLTLMEQKEPTILRAYTTLCLSKSGTLQKSQIMTSLKSVGLPANEDNAVAMMRYLNADTEGSISYSHFRNFMLLLPPERLEDDPRSIWFEAATVVAIPPPMEIPAESVLKSALAGGLACALSTSLLYPVDTMKTRVQASTLSFPELVSRLPQIGLRGLYRGSIPAILGQFSSHGLRTGIFEASKLVLINVAPTLPEIQVQSLASFCSTFLGTAVRIPCEVLKQRLQAGIFDNVGEAIVGTLHEDGFKGFFRGTGATLCREVPFYVAGMGLYAEAKKAAQKLLKRELEAWETIAVGALSGGLAAVVTTPFDVMKTRMMTAQGLPTSMSMVAFSILRQEGPLGLFKGAVPRFFWIAPLGAMNFAGYELARKAMDKSERLSGEEF